MFEIFIYLNLSNFTFFKLNYILLLILQKNATSYTLYYTYTVNMHQIHFRMLEKNPHTFYYLQILNLLSYYYKFCSYKLKNNYNRLPVGQIFYGKLIQNNNRLFIF